MKKQLSLELSIGSRYFPELRDYLYWELFFMANDGCRSTLYTLYLLDVWVDREAYSERGSFSTANIKILPMF